VPLLNIANDPATAAAMPRQKIARKISSVFIASDVRLVPPNDLAHPSLDAGRLERQRKAGWVKGRVQRIVRHPAF